MPKNKQTPGMADAENVFDHFDKKEKEDRRREWLKKNTNHLKPKEGGEKHEGKR